nr:hypothetical protein BaRGS_020833 [Batillaria attramentaria]
MARDKDKTEKLVQYIKEDRPKKFKACVKKYKIDMRRASLPKGRTYLHYAANFGSGSLIHFLLENNVAASKPNHKGDLPLHVAIARALKLHASDASEVYFDVVTPLLEAYPLALDVDNHHGDSGQELLKMLKHHLKKQNHEYQPSSSHADPPPDDDWKEKLAREFESESADFFGRYNDYESGG